MYCYLSLCLLHLKYLRWRHYVFWYAGWPMVVHPSIFCSLTCISCAVISPYWSTDLVRRNCGQMQPHVIVLHSDDADTVFAVVQSGLFYEVGSVIEAADICIKSCFVFGLKYPQLSRSSWTFIQKAVFGLNTQSDHTSIRLLELLSSI